VFLLASVVVLALDQIAKALVAGALAEGECAAWSRHAPIRIRRLGNARALVAAIGSPARIALLWAAAAAALALAAVALFPRDAVARLALGAVLGGVTGNALDGARTGRVLDFVDLRVWPVFNLADAAITCGVALALWRAA
jgi:signal peptidase II